MPGKSKIQKPDNTNEVMEEEKSVDIHGMFETIMEKLSKLDSIDTCMKSLEQEFMDVKASITFVHAEVEDIKKESEQLKKSEGETKKKELRILKRKSSPFCASIPRIVYKQQIWYTMIALHQAPRLPYIT